MIFSYNWPKIDIMGYSKLFKIKESLKGNSFLIFSAFYVPILIGQAFIKINKTKEKSSTLKKYIVIWATMDNYDKNKRKSIIWNKLSNLFLYMFLENLI